MMFMKRSTKGGAMMFMKRSTTFLFCLCIWLVFPRVAFSEPNIHDIAGIVLNSQPVTITGIDFGSHGDHNYSEDYLCFHWDDFEEGDFSKWSQVYQPDSWQTISGNDNRLGSTYCAKRLPGGTGAIGQVPGSQDEYFYSFYFRLEPGYSQSGTDQIKYLRIYSDLYGGSENRNAISINMSYGSVRWSDDANDTIYFMNVSEITTGAWHKWEVWLKKSSTATSTDGAIKIWYDGAAEVSQENLCTHGFTFEDIMRIGEYNLGNYYCEFDDVYYDFSRARVEIGDASSYEGCTIREIQPPTSWSDTSITITVNQGSFADGENVYLFVVDADGIPSAGNGPITIGSGGGATPPPDDDTTPPDDDTTPPGDVTNLTKQVGDGQVVLSWTNPSDSDFKGTLIRYGTDGTYPANNSDGIEVCNKVASPGTSDTYTLTGLSNGTTYYFSAFTYDEDGNYSKAAYISAMPSANVYTKTFGDISGSNFPGTCQDTYINKNDINYSDDSETIRTYTWPTNSAANRIVMKWDLSALPQDAVVQEAILSLYMNGFSGIGGDDNYEITAHKIINHNPDILSCTWNTYDATNSWTGGANGGEQDIASAESSTIVDKTSGYKNWNITQMVQGWVNNSSTNFGLILNSDTTAASDSNRYFRPTEYLSQDQRPVLIIKYGGSDIPKVPSVPSGLVLVVGN